MDHNQAIQQKAAERYLLNELAPDARDAFEEHLFECPECALDVRAGAAFVDEAKIQLPELVQQVELPARPTVGRSEVPRRPLAQRAGWFGWWRPIVAAPAFAALLLVLGYQNLVTLPGLRAAANGPRLIPMAAVQEATRGAARAEVVADPKRGIALPLDIAPVAGMPAFASYSFDLYDPQHKLDWSRQVAAPANSESREEQFSLEIPGAFLRNGLYTVAVSGIGPNGKKTAIQTYGFDLHLAGEAGAL